MKKFAFLLLLFPCVLLSQNPSDKKIPLDSLWQETDASLQKHFRIIENYDNAQDEYKVTDYYSEGKPYRTGMTNARGKMVETGEFTYYYESGSKKATIFYVNSNEEGPYTYWYENGTKKEEGLFETNKDAALPGEKKIYQYWDISGTQKVTDGFGDYEETNAYNQLGHGSGKLEHGSKNGEWTGSSFKPGYTYTETYDKGKFISGVRTDSIQTKSIYKKLFEKPEPQKGIQNFYKFIMKNFKVPDAAMEVGGKIVLAFIVEKDGTITDIRIIKSGGNGLDEEAIRVLKKYPAWEPGKFRGVNVRILFTIPITILADSD